MLSANLAVINFLPIPLLDGGHMVFLAYEGIRGRPANERFVVALHTAGFVFIVDADAVRAGARFQLDRRGICSTSNARGRRNATGHGRRDQSVWQSVTSFA